MENGIAAMAVAATELWRKWRRFMIGGGKILPVNAGALEKTGLDGENGKEGNGLGSFHDFPLSSFMNWRIHALTPSPIFVRR
jgi:hypothetical protein